MSFHWCDNLHTAVFSPRDYQVELLAAAFENNTMICLGHKSSKEFIALKLLQELGRTENSLNRKISIYLSVNKAPSMFTMLNHLTDLRVYQETSETTISFDELPKDFNIYILHPKTCLRLLRDNVLKLQNVNLLVLEDCHQDSVHVDIMAIFRDYYKISNTEEMPKVLGLAGPLHSAGCDLSELSAMLNNLEGTVQCRTETASDIVTVLRYCAKPFEYILQCAPYKQDELCFLLQDILLTRKAFLNDHRYDPFEIYCTDEYIEELKDIPDPKKEPLEFLDTMLQVLQEMGPWSADRVAFNMYQRIEKQKIKTPHERHYILLCLVNTALLEVHAICEQNFRKLKNIHKDCVEAYSSPKVCRLLEVLRLFKPEDNSSKNDTMKRIGLELDQMDFQKLSRVLETKCHSVEQAVEKQQLESRSIVENLDSIIKPEFQSRTTSDETKEATPCTDDDNKPLSNIQKTDDNATAVTNTSLPTNARRHTTSHHHHNRPKRRPFNRRHNRNEHDAADTLCSIIFCNSNYTARVLFELLAEMSRHDPDLKFIKCQFTTDRVADPITEPKEAESEHRRQEEVLKRFRMHDCNVLVGTSVLEEGIDVPKCNLVVRWDPPTTYRSYVQCKGRARAVPAYHVVLVASDFDDGRKASQDSGEQLTNKSHRLICDLPEEEENCLTDSDESEKENSEEENKNDMSAKKNFVYGSSKGTIKILNPEVITNKHPSSKPSTTATDIILKEIQEETLALEDVSRDKEIANVVKINTIVIETSTQSSISPDITVNTEKSPAQLESDDGACALSETQSSNKISPDITVNTEESPARLESDDVACTLSETQSSTKISPDITANTEESSAQMESDDGICALSETQSSNKISTDITVITEESPAHVESDDGACALSETQSSHKISQDITVNTEESPTQVESDDGVCALSETQSSNKISPDITVNTEESSAQMESDDGDCALSETQSSHKISQDITVNTEESPAHVESDDGACALSETTEISTIDTSFNSDKSVIESNDDYKVLSLSALVIEETPQNTEISTANEEDEQIETFKEEKADSDTSMKDSNVFDFNAALKDLESNNDTSNTANEEIIQRDKKFFHCLLHETAEENDSNIISNETIKYESMKRTTNAIVKQMAEYREIEKMLLQKCANTEPAEKEHRDADAFNNCIKPYKPLPRLLTGASVDLSNSIALINKYCAKLPSDTFTKLTPLWRCARTIRNQTTMYQYTLRLPINSPLKYDIIGLPMPTHILARRMAALQACIELHKSGELDNNLQPIGKEGFKAIESDWENFELEEQDERIVQENSEPRPGTTKRRQYYYKRIASEFCYCRPTVGQPCYLYLLELTLECPIPEEQNTRGRKIYPPEDALQGFGILTLKKIPKVSSFPIFTRSGEVKVSLVLHPERVFLSAEQITSINTFINYTFTKVLRLKKFLMLFDPESTENCVFIVPTVKTTEGNCKDIDWTFLDLIERNANMMPTPVPETIRHATEFSADKFKDAVIMPWYRNQDQPHYFYVAEICHQLSPLSIFPSLKYKTFMHYYYLKYSLKIQAKQPLLDVDHTSARLNFLTPRYVNRKGVALPTSSEATKRAKRENLELKQILVPELCTVHPFPASLWRTAVCLPCILYRINGLLLADDIRKKVVQDMALGQPELSEDKEWPMLDFGWSLSDVLKKSKASRQQNSEASSNMDDSGGSLAQKDKNHKKSDNVKISDDLDDDGTSDGGVREDKTINEIVQDAERKLQEEGGGGFIEIGTWSNDMVYTAPENEDDYDEDDYDELMDGLLPPMIKFCGKDARATSPTFTDIILDEEETIPKKPNFNCYDSDDSFGDSSFASDAEMIDDDDESDNYQDDIVLTARNEAETVETEQDIEKLNKQLSIIQATKANERDYQETKNLQVGYNFPDIKQEIAEKLQQSIEQFKKSTQQLMDDIRNCGMLVKYDQNLKLPEKCNERKDCRALELCMETYKKFIPYCSVSELKKFLNDSETELAICIETLQSLNLKWLQQHPNEQYVIEGSGDIFDCYNDAKNLVVSKEGGKIIRLNFESQGKEYHTEIVATDKGAVAVADRDTYPIYNFSFDQQPDLYTHPGPSPSIILQALTMSNANDGINLERLETIGDSFLKYAITTYLYITYENVHEGKLSHLRSKQVANLNLYRLGRRKVLGEYMIATKFEPSDNWLPPCYYVPKELEKALIEAKIPPHYWSLVDLVNIKKLSNAEICELVRKKADEWGVNFTNTNDSADLDDTKGEREWDDPENIPQEYSCFIPYNLVSQHSIPDKSVADCVEALIGAYLIECGLRGALLFMAWLGIRVIPYERIQYDPNKQRIPGSTLPDEDGMITVYGSWTPPKSPLLHYTPNAEQELEILLQGYDEFEQILGYKFRDRSYLLQAMTHASYTPNRLTDCYQRLEFLGDAVLDYLITRHLYEDPRQHSPGALTDLRSALVNNTIFASLAVRHGFHKYFRHLSPGLNEVIDRFVRIQTENGHSISEEYYLLSEEECDDAEDVEVPKALGDVFESVAGAIFLDSNMSLDAVWHVYYNMMRPEIEQFSNSVPKSPIRELLELEPETAKFGKPEKLADGRRVRVTVEVFCKGTYRGIGRNYRIAKCTAAKCALRQLKKKGLIDKRS